MKKVKVKIKIEYHAEPKEEEPAAAFLSILLPADEEKILEILRSPTHLAGENLFSGWGKLKKEEEYEARGRLEDISSVDWRELEKRINEKIAEIKATLRGVVARNRALLREQPADREIAISL